MTGESGADVRRRREAIDWTVPQLASAAGVDPAVVRYWESGRTERPRKAGQVLRALARAEEEFAAGRASPARVDADQEVSITTYDARGRRLVTTGHIDVAPAAAAELARLLAEQESSERPTQ